MIDRFDDWFPYVKRSRLSLKSILYLASPTILLISATKDTFNSLSFGIDTVSDSYQEFAMRDPLLNRIILALTRECRKNRSKRP